jgi:hypothetical protein
MLPRWPKRFPPGVASGPRYPQSQLAHLDSERRLTA